MSISGGMDKKDVVHIYNGIPLGHKKEQNYAICSNMDELDILTLSEVRKRKAKTLWYHLHLESNIQHK